MSLAYCLIPLVGAFIGWASIYVVSLFLWYPAKSLKMGPVEIQGVIPKLKLEISKKGKSFLSEESLHELLGHLDWERDLIPLMDRKIALFVDNLKKQMPMIGMFLTGALEENLKRQAKEHFCDLDSRVKAGDDSSFN